jgi:hypothetical protein
MRILLYLCLVLLLLLLLVYLLISISVLLINFHHLLWTITLFLILYLFSIFKSLNIILIILLSYIFVIELERLFEFSVLKYSDSTVSWHRSNELHLGIDSHTLHIFLMPIKSLYFLELVVLNTPKNCGSIHWPWHQMTWIPCPT